MSCIPILFWIIWISAARDVANENSRIQTEMHEAGAIEIVYNRDGGIEIRKGR
jgi:hypothetical protein